MFNKKRIDELERRISDLERSSKIEVYVGDGAWNNPPQVSVVWVLKQVLKHIGLEIHYEHSRSESFTLQNVEQANKACSRRVPRRGAKVVKSKSKAWLVAHAANANR